MGETLTTKNDIVNYLKTKYGATDHSDNFYSLEVKWNDGRSQLVFVFVGDNIVSVSSPVGKVSDVNIENLVKYVSDTSPWGVRIIGDWVTISDAGFTESMDAVELDVPIRFISEAADEIEHAVSNGGDAL
jgi:hypothetical protein